MTITVLAPDTLPTCREVSTLCLDPSPASFRAVYMVAFRWRLGCGRMGGSRDGVDAPERTCVVYSYMRLPLGSVDLICLVPLIDGLTRFVYVDCPLLKRLSSLILISTYPILPPSSFASGSYRRSSDLSGLQRPETVVTVA